MSPNHPNTLANDPEEPQDEEATNPPTTKPIPTDTLTPTPAPTATYTPVPTETPAHEPGTLMTNTIDGASMAYIPPGEFMMGSESGKEDEQPVHPVYTSGFWMYQYTVTNAQYGQCIAAGGCEEPKNPSYNTGSSQTIEWIKNGMYNDHPVMHLAQKEAQNYCEWAGGRLPTEAEWEKAARGGLVGMTYPWGNDEPVCTLGADNGAWYKGCDSDSDNPSAPVGSFAPNGYGLYDMAGNVWEWVSDKYGEDYYNLLEYDNPQGPKTGTYYVQRGGDFRGSQTPLRVTVRNHTSSGAHPNGFRCVLIP
jgi:formylglycine-generating enzyme required for sulfatase activity